jgi:hypothetical protein
MPYIVKKLGTGLTSRAGSSFGGVTPAKVDADTYLTADGSLVEDKSKAQQYALRDAAEKVASAMRTSFSAFDVEVVP